MNIDEDDGSRGREKSPRLPGCHALTIGGPKSAGIGNSGPSSNATEQTDMSIVSGADSLNQTVRLDGSGNTLTVTDFGAVDGALKLALAGVEGQQAITKTTLEATGGLLDGALRMAGEQQQQFTDAVENIKTSDVRVLVVAGLAVVGLGAVYLFKKG